MKHNKAQWISVFEYAMVRLQPHFTTEILTPGALRAWDQKGTMPIAYFMLARTATSTWSVASMRTQP